MSRHRVLDLVLLCLLAPIALPVGLLLAAAVILDSPGPVIYRARRVGHGGRPFEMLKFRKMREDATGRLLTDDTDERFTPIGRFLAKTRLDELPQLINVLRGDMHFVGPRPEVEQFVDFCPSEYREILTTRPGITGLTQLRFPDESRLLAAVDDPEGYYRDHILPQKVAIDLEYVRTRSVRGDLKILLRTMLLSVRLIESTRPPVITPLGIQRSPQPVTFVALPAVVLLMSFLLVAGPLH